MDHAVNLDRAQILIGSEEGCNIVGWSTVCGHTVFVPGEL